MTGTLHGVACLDVCACGVHLLWVEDDVAMLHLLVHRAVGEAAPADADALQHAVASQLMQHQSEDRYTSDLLSRRLQEGQNMIDLRRIKFSERTHGL